MRSQRAIVKSHLSWLLKPKKKPSFYWYFSWTFEIVWNGRMAAMLGTNGHWPLLVLLDYNMCIIIASLIGRIETDNVHAWIFLPHFKWVILCVFEWVEKTFLCASNKAFGVTTRMQRHQKQMCFLFVFSLRLFILTTKHISISCCTLCEHLFL